MKTWFTPAMWMAMIGLLCPFPNQIFAQDGTQPQMFDLVLSEDGVLRGQVADANGNPKAEADVTLSADNTVIGQAVTNEQGAFAFNVGRGGVFVLSEGGRSVYVRVWTANAAPPGANSAILLVSDQASSQALYWGAGIVLIGGGVVAIVAIATAS